MKIDTRLKSKIFQRSDSLQKFYTDIAKYPILGVDEEVELFHSYRNDGDIRARDKIIQSNQRFVVSVAKKYAKTEIELMDMISEGNIGLMKAAEKFDTTYGFKFISYAVHWIYSYISTYLNKRELIKKNVDYQLRKKVEEIRKELNKEGWDVNISTIASILKDRHNIHVSEEELCAISTISIDIPIDDTDYVSGLTDFNEFYCSHNEVTDAIDDDHNKFLVETYLSYLTAKEQEVIKLYFGIDGEEALGTFAMVAQRLEIPNHRAAGLFHRGLRKMQIEFRRTKKRRSDYFSKNILSDSYKFLNS